MINKKPLNSFVNKLKKNLNNFQSLNDVMDKTTDFLKDTVIFIDSEINMDTNNCFRNLIAICGGYWMEKFSSVVTHVIDEEIDQEKYQKFKKFGGKVHILRAEWLVDSIFLYNHLDEQDYVIRNFKLN